VVNVCGKVFFVFFLAFRSQFQEGCFFNWGWGTPSARWSGYAGRYIHFGVREHAMLSILIFGGW
jgi:hypothetical protein